LIDLRSVVEHTLLKPEATETDMARVADEAMEHRLFGVCVPPLFVSFVRARLGTSAVRLVTVVGFPAGYSLPAVKAEEARRAVGDGADEVDVVIPLGLARTGEWGRVQDDVRAVRAAVPVAILKVILETGHFSETDLERAALAVVAAGADFVKTSTGYGPRGATVRDIEVLSRAVGGRARIKASGGIRTSDEARALVAAGAARIGTSNGVGIALGQG
jgi:deoxyribose-phosphate aldolase